MKTFRLGGIHPRQNKLTAGSPITPLPVPPEIVLVTGQHIGRAATPVVAKGDHVEAGQLVAEAAGPVSANIHTPLTGTVTKIDTAKTPQGQPVPAIYIKPDADARPAEAPADVTPEQVADATPGEIVEAVRRAGVVGLGGATFPTAVKLTPPPGMKADVVIINGAECEPYLTCDDALMREQPARVVAGSELLRRAAGVDRAIIVLEDNKPEACRALKAEAKRWPGVEVLRVKTKYPQGGEKQLIEAVTGREVPNGALPVAAGAIVQNVATAAAVADAVVHGLPLTSRVVTVTGPGVTRRGNYLVPLGTPLKALIEAAGGLPDDTAKVIAGGPMMGRAVQQLDSHATKGLSGLLIVPEREARRREPEPCIRCGGCVTACPMGLEPYLLAAYSARGLDDDARKAGAANCIECGSCSWTCPSHRPLLDLIRVAKARAMKRK